MPCPTTVGCGTLMADSRKPATIAAHAAGAMDVNSAGVVPPLQSSSTFLRDSDYALVRPDNIYLRDDNDTVRHAEEVIRQLEGAAETRLFPSGMAAIAAVFQALSAGDAVLVQADIYYGASKWIETYCARREIALHRVDGSDLSALQTACETIKPRLVYVETPSNPLLKIVDIAAAAECTHAHGGLLMVDATAATPVLMQPLSLGADIVMHSATKAISGHSDLLAGVLSVNDPDAALWQTVKADRHDAGAVLGSFEAWLLIRSMRTLPLRVEAMTANAKKLAMALAEHPAIAEVMYPGLESHPGHAIARRQMPGFGSLMSVCVAGGRAEALAVIGKLTVFLRATSLGGVESLVEHRASIEPHSGLPENLIRVSVGIEDFGDLIADWEQALTGL